MERKIEKITYLPLHDMVVCNQTQDCLMTCECNKLLEMGFKIYVDRKYIYLLDTTRSNENPKYTDYDNCCHIVERIEYYTTPKGIIFDDYYCDYLGTIADYLNLKYLQSLTNKLLSEGYVITKIEDCEDNVGGKYECCYNIEYQIPVLEL